MKYLLILLILIGFVWSWQLSFSELNYPDALKIPFNDSDLVLVGTIISKDELSNQTTYGIKVEDYLKNSKSFDMISAISYEIKNQTNPNTEVHYYNEPFFDVEQKVFVYLKMNESGEYIMSPHSFALEKNEARGPPPSIIWMTGPTKFQFDQGEEIIISGLIKKAYLYDSIQREQDPSINLKIFDKNNELLDSEKLNAKVDGTFDYQFQIKGESRIPGKYSYEIQLGPETMNGEFIIEINPNLWTPLKQFKSGIHLEDIICKKSLSLVTKYDGSPACVKPKTKTKLIERGWVISNSDIVNVGKGVDLYIIQDNSLKQEILAQLRKEPKNLNDNAKEFILSEVLSDKRVSDLLGDTKFQTFWTINSELGKSSIKYSYGITFQLNEKDSVNVVYDLQQEKITSVESGKVFGSSSGEAIPEIKISKGDLVSEKAIKFNGWTNQPNQEIVLTVTAPDGNIISTGKISPMSNGTFADAITTGGPLWKQQNGIYLVTVQQGDGSTNRAHFEFNLKDGKIINKNENIDRNSKDIVSETLCQEKNNIDLVKIPQSSEPSRLVFTVKQNSTAHICIKYSSNLDNEGSLDLNAELYDGYLGTYNGTKSNVSVTINPRFIPLQNGQSTIADYAISIPQNTDGVFWLTVSQMCDSIPIATSNHWIMPDDIPVIVGGHSCPAISLDAKIIGYSNAEAQYHVAKALTGR